MELDKSGVYCVAKCDHGERVEAICRLPYPIDLSKHPAEVAVKYIAITPTWNHYSDLQLEVVDEAIEDSDVIEVVFNDIVETTQATVILHIRQRLEAKFPKTPLLRIVKSRNRKTSEFRLRQHASLKFSSELSRILGVDEVHHSSETEELVIPILFHDEQMTSTTDIYYLKSEEVASNFMLDSRQDRIVELLHLPGTETLDFHPNMVYSRLEVTLLEKISFTLYNEANRWIRSVSPDLYIVCHLRPQQ